MAKKVRSDGLSRREHEVAEILSELPDLIKRFDSTPYLRVFWGMKGARTPTKSTRPPAGVKEIFAFTWSPDNPLGFCGGPEEKLNHSKRKPSLDGRMEDLSSELVNLNQERETLMGELLKLKLQYDELKFVNLELKAKKRKSISGDEKQKTHVDVEIKKSAVETSEIPQDNQTIECQHDRQPSNENQTAGTSGQSIAFLDRNTLPEEHSRIGYWANPATEERKIARMMAAKARQQRLQKRRFKKQSCLQKTTVHLYANNKIFIYSSS